MQNDEKKPLKGDKKGVVLSVRIIPNSSNNSVLGYCSEYLKIKIAAPAIENKANKELILYLSDIFKLPKTKISFIAGEKSKIKRIMLAGTTLSDISENFSVYDKISS